MNDKTYRKISIIMLMIAAIFVYGAFLLKCQDNDMYFEIVSGRDILNGNFYTVSHLNGFPIVIQQWLYAVCLALADKLGTIGLMSFVLIQDIILGVLSSIFIYEKSKNRPNAKRNAIIGSFFAIIFCHEYMINVRPQIITMILIVAELILLEKYKKSHTIIKERNVSYLIFIIPLLIIAANFHQAVFLYHILVLAPYYIEVSNIKRRVKTTNSFKSWTWLIDWKVVFFTPIYLVCSLCTPYGLDGVLYVIRTLMSDVYKIIPIAEIKPIEIFSYTGLKLLVLVVIGVIYLVYQYKKYDHIVDHHTLFFTFLIFLLALSNMRHMSISFIAVMFILANVDLTILKKPFVYLILALGCFGISLVVLNNFQWQAETYTNVANVIEDHNAKIFNSAVDVGGWLEYNDYTNIYMDSRCEAFYDKISGEPDRIEPIRIIQTGYNNNREFVSNEEIMSLVDEYDYIISYKSDYINRICDWNLIYEDDQYMIWEK